MKSVTIIGGGKPENQRTNHFYPTPPECTIAMLAYMHHWHPEMKVWEPASGEGDMSKVLELHFNDVLSTDLRDGDKIYGQTRVDFLMHHSLERFDLICTNPPFNLAQPFIEHALWKAGKVAMLLKSTYWHAATRTELFQKYPPSHILALNWRPDFSFKWEAHGNPQMDMAWSVWDNGDKQKDIGPTIYDVLEKPELHHD